MWPCHVPCRIFSSQHLAPGVWSSPSQCGWRHCLSVLLGNVCEYCICWGAAGEGAWYSIHQGVVCSVLRQDLQGWEGQLSPPNQVSVLAPLWSGLLFPQVATQDAFTFSKSLLKPLTSFCGPCPYLKCHFMVTVGSASMNTPRQ